MKKRSQGSDPTKEPTNMNQSIQVKEQNFRSLLTSNLRRKFSYGPSATILNNGKYDLQPLLLTFKCNKNNHIWTSISQNISIILNLTTISHKGGSLPPRCPSTSVEPKVPTPGALRLLGALDATWRLGCPGGPRTPLEHDFHPF